VLLVRRERAGRQWAVWPDGRAGAPADHRAGADQRGRFSARSPNASGRSANVRFLAEASEQLGDSLAYDLTLTPRNPSGRAVPGRLVHLRSARRGRPDPAGGGRSRRCAKESLLHETLQQFPIQLDEPRGVAIALRTGETLIQPEITQEEVETVARDARHLQILQELRPRSHLIVPLISHGQRLGCCRCCTLTTRGGATPMPIGRSPKTSRGGARRRWRTPSSTGRPRRRGARPPGETPSFGGANQALHLEMAERALAQEQLLEANLQLEAGARRHRQGFRR